MHQLLFADQPPRIPDDVFERFIHLGAQLDFNAGLEQTAFSSIQHKITEFIRGEIRLQMCFRLRKAKQP